MHANQAFGGAGRRTPSALLPAVCLLLMAAPAPAQQDTPTPPLDGIAHVALRVGDLAASTAFYQKLGFERAFDIEAGEVGAGSKGGARSEGSEPNVGSKGSEGKTTANATSAITFFKINDRQFLELYPASPAEPAIGFLHVCFEGEDLEAISEDYASHGLIAAPIHTSPAGNLLFTVRGPIQPSGPQTIEYVQYLPDSLHTRDIGKHLGEDRVADMVIAVALAMDDPDAARDFYINQLNFKPIAGDPMDLHMPGNSGQEVEIVTANLGRHAHLTLNSENLGRAARHLHKEGVPAEKNGASLTITDPDGNILLLESR